MKRRQVRPSAGQPLVEVYWIDSFATHGWSAPVEGYHPGTLWTSVGYLLRNSRREVVICQSKDPWGKTGENLTIPRSCVRWIRRPR